MGEKKEIREKKKENETRGKIETHEKGTWKLTNDKEIWDNGSRR